MPDNPRYQNSGIGYSAYPITPTVDPVGMRAQAAATGDIASLLDRMGQSLYKTATEEAQRQGLQWGAENPVSVDQLNAAIAAGDDPLATRYTHFGEAARKVQATILGTNLNAMGVAEMAQVQAAVELGKMPASAAVEKMDAISSAYSSTLAKVDPETGIKLRAALTSHSSSIYSHLAQQEVKKVQAAQKASIDDYFARLPKTLETEFMAGDTTDPKTGVVITAEARVSAQRAQAIQAARITGDASYGTKFDKAVSDARINSFTKRFSQTDWAEDPVTALAKIDAWSTGKALGSSWEAMTEEERIKVKERTIKEFAQRYDVVAKKDSAERLQAKNQTEALLLEYYSPGTTGSRKVEIQREVRVLGVIPPSEYKALLKGDDEFMSKNREAEVADMIDTGVITNFQQLKKVASGAALVRLQKSLRTEGNQSERQSEGILLEAVAGTKSPVAALNSKEQEEKFNLQNRYRAEVAAKKAAGEPFSYSDIATSIAEEYKQKRFAGQRKQEQDFLTRTESELSAAQGRQITLKTMDDVANLEKLGAWKGKESLKRRVVSSLSAVNAPVLIPQTPGAK
jgi:hypothetical protein